MKLSCFLHIGAPKTGSTSIQYSLHASHACLAESGYYYSLPEKNHRFIVSSFIDDPAQFDYNKSQRLHAADIEKRNRDRLLKLEADFVASGCQNLILSCEHLVLLSATAISSLKEYLSARFDSVVVILYLRHPILAVGSYVQELLKNGARRLDSMAVNPPFTRAQHVLRQWSSAFDRNSIKVRDMHPDCLYNSDLIDDFLYCIGCAGLSSRVSRVRANETLSHPAVLVADQLAGLYPKYAEGRAPQRKINDVLRRIVGPKYVPSAQILEATELVARSDLDYLLADWSVRLVGSRDWVCREEMSELWGENTLRSIAEMVNRLAQTS